MRTLSCRDVGRGEARAALRAWQVTGGRTERATGGASSVVLPEHRGESGPPGRGGGAGGGRVAPRVWLSSGPGRLLSHAPCRPSGTLRGGRVAGEAGRDVPRDRHTRWSDFYTVLFPSLTHFAAFAIVSLGLLFSGRPELLTDPSESSDDQQLSSSSDGAQTSTALKTASKDAVAPRGGACADGRAPRQTPVCSVPQLPGPPASWPSQK